MGEVMSYELARVGQPVATSTNHQFPHRHLSRSFQFYEIGTSRQLARVHEVVGVAGRKLANVEHLHSLTEGIEQQNAAARGIGSVYGYNG